MHRGTAVTCSQRFRFPAVCHLRDQPRAVSPRGRHPHICVPRRRPRGHPAVKADEDVWGLELHGGHRAVHQGLCHGSASELLLAVRLDRCSPKPGTRTHCVQERAALHGQCGHWRTRAFGRAEGLARPADRTGTVTWSRAPGEARRLPGTRGPVTASRPFCQSCRLEVAGPGTGWSPSARLASGAR